MQLFGAGGEPAHREVRERGRARGGGKGSRAELQITDGLDGAGGEQCTRLGVHFEGRDRFLGNGAKNAESCQQAADAATFRLGERLEPYPSLKEGGRFFACSDFRKQGSKDEYYDIDFWLDDKSGKISVGEVRVHKVPVLQEGNFVQVPRYSFDPKTFDVVP